MITDAAVRALPFFADLPWDRCGWLPERLVESHVDAGTYLMRQGEPLDAFIVLVEGETVALRAAEGAQLPAGRHLGPAYLGEIPILSDLPTEVSIKTLMPSRIWKLAPDDFRRLLHECPAFERTIFRTMSTRLRGLESHIQQREKMAALGTLAAGLAHELNNPAAAVARAVDRLGKLLGDLEESAWALAAAAPSQKTLDALREAIHLAESRRAEHRTLDAMATADAEEALATWCEERGCTRGWEVAPALAAGGLTPDALSSLESELSEEVFDATIIWLAAALDARGLLDEAGTAGDRLVGIVKAMKSYSHLDRGPQQEVDIHEGIDDTLVILNHRLKHSKIVVHRDYDRTLPRIPVYGSELNQVWTNLLDNAIDALDGKGTITITTRRDMKWVTVEVADDGPGIPVEIQSRVFEPFYTTKPPGKGTGLGLELAYRTVTFRHGGQLTVSSQPGDTRFVVRLPLTGVFTPLGGAPRTSI